MNILYLTYENIITQPIIDSQVISLLTYFNTNGVNSILVTLKEKNVFYKNDKKKLIFIFIKPRLFIINVFIYAIKIMKVINRNQIIHVRSYIPMFPLLLIKPFIKNKIIFDMRGVLPEEFIYRNNGFKDKFQSRVFSFFENIFLKISDKVVVVSTPFKKHIMSKYPYLKQENIHVIPTLGTKLKSNEINTIDSKLKYFSDKEIVLFVYSGSIGGWQNFEETVELFKKIQQHISNARLIVFTKDLDKATNILSQTLQNKLYSVDSLSYNDLSKSLASCDFGFLLRKNNIVNRVASPIKFSDYVNSNTNVIATSDIGDISKIILNYKIGCIIPNISIDDDCLKKLIYDINTLCQIPSYKRKVNFNKVQELFSLENIAEQYKKVYFELL